MMKPMKILSCRSLGLDCDFISIGHSDYDVLIDYRYHVEVAHPETVDQMLAVFNDEEVADAMTARIKVAV